MMQYFIDSKDGSLHHRNLTSPTKKANSVHRSFLLDFI